MSVDPLSPRPSEDNADNAAGVGALSATPHHSASDNADNADNADSQGSKVEDFPLEALPQACERVVRESAEAIGCPPDFIALPMLVTLGAGIGNSRVAQLKNGWEESSAVFAAVIAEPGAKKTPAHNIATEPARAYQASLREDYRKALDSHKSALRQHKADEREATKNGHSAPPPPLEPAMERVLVEDTTIEALAGVLEDNPQGVQVVRDELSAWIRSQDQYRASGKGSDRQWWLSAWSGSYVSVDRRNRGEPLILTHPFIGLFGSIQPAILPELGQGREDGLKDRFLYAYPDPVFSRWSEAEISTQSRQAYRSLYDKLQSLHMPTDDHGDPDPERVYFSTDAKQRFVDATNNLREEMETPGFPHSLRGPWSKLEASLARLSLILATCRAIEEDAPERIEERDLKSAEQLLSYFKSHAKRVYTGLHEEDADENLAADIARFLAERGGYFKDEPHVLFNELASRHSPERPEDLTRALKRIAASYPGLKVVTGKSFKKQGKNRRCLELTLRESALSALSALSEALSSGSADNAPTTAALSALSGKSETAEPPAEPRRPRPKITL